MIQNNLGSEDSKKEKVQLAFQRNFAIDGISVKQLLSMQQNYVWVYYLQIPTNNWCVYMWMYF